MKRKVPGRVYYVYRALDADGVVLYVGITRHPKERASEHVRWPWGKSIARWRVSGPYEADKAIQLERETIWLENPVVNVERYTHQRYLALVAGGVA